jgi:UDP-arabinose 4-epimerase
MATNFRNYCPNLFEEAHIDMNILVTGGAGYIGSHTCKALAEAGLSPVTYDNLSTGHEWAVKWGPLVIGDLCDGDLVRRTMRTYNVKAVLHFAASSLVGESVRHPRKYFQNNLVNTLGLLDAMLDGGVRAMVFSSTCATYGEPQSETLDESHPQLPVNPYGETKLAIERAMRWYGEAYGMRTVCLRYFNAAGADQDAGIGEMHEPETHLIPLVLEAALDPERPVSIFGTDFPTPDGSAIRDYIHVSDLADAHLRAVAMLTGGGNSTSVNLGTGRGHSVRQVIASVERVAGRRVAAVEAHRRAGDPARLVATAQLARTLLNWQPRRSNLDHIVRSAWQWRTRSLSRSSNIPVFSQVAMGD